MIIDLNEDDKEIIEDLETKFKEIFNVSILNDFNYNPYTKYLVYLVDDKAVGFINYYFIYDRIEIVNFNVLEEFQNQHIGSSLLEELIDISKYNKLINITLEVREDNKKAIYLYSKYGFKKVSIRKNYYNGINALLMEKEMM